MNTILVATDFSANAHWATDYALELARQLHARLVLIHAYEPIPNLTMPPDLMATESTRQYEQTMGQLSILRNKMLDATNWPVDISVVARPGSLSDCIVEEAASLQADLLVMGVAGNDPLKARQLGSLALKMIPRTKVPMLLVPPGAAYQKPKIIVLAIDLSNPIDALALASAKWFAQLLAVKLDVICMEDEPDETLQKAAAGISVLLADQPHTVHFLAGNDLSDVLNEYTLTHQTDMIMLLPKPHNWLRTALLESDTQEVVRLTTIPVLAAV
ncbi:universal stress protein [Spirosoma spitsbergense]|uniref:universal stress protein n=1 Tax=Spirosoma spitsbergense TaxID=431554 RepID=UPI00037C8379|nr:universal stress protein [Spirosoma spitsbergense]